MRWAERFVRFHDTTHPRPLDEDGIRTFLNHLASTRNVAASTQNRALNALMFLYEQVLAREEVQRAVKKAADAAEIEKRATCHNPSP